MTHEKFKESSECLVEPPTFIDRMSAAERYCRWGWQMYPQFEADRGQCTCGRTDCLAPGEHSPDEEWARGASSRFLGDGSVDLGVYRRFAKYRRASLGAIVGRESGFFVTAAVGPEGERSLNTLAEKRGDFSPTLACRTDGELRLFFRYPEREVESKYGVLGKGVNILGDGARIVVPPSALQDRPCVWVDGSAEIAEAPVWLLELICRPNPSYQAADGIEAPELGGTDDVQACEEIEQNLGAALSIPGPHPAAVNTRQLHPVSRRPATSIIGGTNSLPWFPFDTTAWRRSQSVAEMDDVHVGWFVWLTVECWERGGYLPSDPKHLFKLARAKSAKKFQRDFHIVLAEFELGEDETQLVHPGLRAEYESRAETVEKRRTSGQKRWEPKLKPDSPPQSK